jgi:hypothetical protein
MVDNSLLLIYNGLLVVSFDVWCYSKGNFYNRRVKIMKTKNNFRGILAILTFALAVVLIVALAGCGDNDGSDGAQNGNYTVTFKRASANVDLGTVFTQSVAPGQKAAVPPAGTQGPGETFFGWFKGLGENDGGNILFDFNAPIAGNTVIYGRAAKQQAVTVENADAGMVSMRRNVGYEGAGNGVAIYYYNSEGAMITLNVISDAYSSANDKKGFFLVIIKPLKQNLNYVFNAYTYTIKEDVMGTFYPVAGTANHATYYTYAATGSYFEVKTINRYMDSNVSFGGITVSPDRIPIFESEQKKMEFTQERNMNGFRIKSVSRDAIELDGSMFWDGGYYYRLRPVQ